MKQTDRWTVTKMVYKISCQNEIAKSEWCVSSYEGEEVSNKRAKSSKTKTSSAALGFSKKLFTKLSGPFPWDASRPFKQICC